MFTNEELTLANQQLKTIHITKSLDELYQLANSKKAWTDYEKTMIRAHFRNGYALFMFVLFKKRPRYFDLLQLYVEEIEIPRLKEKEEKVKESGRNYWGGVIIACAAFVLIAGKCI